MRYQVHGTTTGKYKVIPSRGDFDWETFIVETTTKPRATAIAAALNTAVKILKVKYSIGELSLIAQEFASIGQDAGE